jgi:16S rRNA (cytosine967-C5)-methyltransferase
MKFHKNLFQPILYTLHQIFFQEVKDHVAVQKMLESQPKWGSRDRKAAANFTYEITRYWRKYWYILNLAPSQNLELMWGLIAVWMIVHDEDLPEWSELKAFDPEKIRERISESATIFAVKESIPDWLDAIGRKQLGTKWEAEMVAQNQEAALVLRVNSSKIKAEKVVDMLLREDVVATSSPELPSALVLDKRINLQNNAMYKEGMFEVQDISSQMVTLLLDIKEGQIVIDACAGAGGKSLHMADIMRNSGRIIAMDIEIKKLKELQRRVEKARFNKVETVVLADPKMIERYRFFADRLLLDVPCSGSGVFRRNPDDKIKLSAEKLEKLVVTQQNILATYPEMLKKGGIMVYATCSILPVENEQQINRFLEENPNFKLIESKRILTSETGYDGFFMAKLMKS